MTRSEDKTTIRPSGGSERLGLSELLYTEDEVLELLFSLNTSKELIWTIKVEIH